MISYYKSDVFSYSISPYIPVTTHTNSLGRVLARRSLDPLHGHWLALQCGIFCQTCNSSRDMDARFNAELPITHNSMFRPSTSINASEMTYLRCYVLACASKCGTWLYSMKFWYNSGFHSSTAYHRIGKFRRFHLGYRSSLDGSIVAESLRP